MSGDANSVLSDARHMAASAASHIAGVSAHGLAVRPPLFHEVLTPHVCSKRFRRVCAWLGPAGVQVAASFNVCSSASKLRWRRWCT